jgi:hypothetical protein
VKLANPFASADAVRAAAAGCTYNDSDATDMLAPGARLAAGTGSFDDFLAIARWKSPRPKKWHRANDPAHAIDVLRTAVELGPDSWRISIPALCTLRGVKIPTASALLAALFGGEFPIIDCRSLQALGIPRDAQTINHDTLAVDVPFCQREATRLGVSVRELDRALWTEGRQKA